MLTNYTTFKPDLKGVKNISSKLIGNTYHIQCERIDKRPSCCNKKMNIKDYRNVKIKDLPYADRKVLVQVRKQRYICPLCRKTITGSLDFVKRRCTISEGIRREILRKLCEVKSLKQIAIEEKVSTSTVFRELDRLEIDKREDKDSSVIYLDEFKGNAGNGKYQLAVYDKNRTLIDVLEDRNSSTIKKFLRQLVIKPSIVVTDMFKPFRPAIISVIPKGEIVVDKYHVIRQADWMIRDIRINMFNSDNKKYREYKKYWKLIAKSPVKKFTERQMYRINKLKALNERFSVAYELRKEFYELFKLDDIKRFRDGLSRLIAKLSESGIKECIYLGETFRNWKEEIINIIRYGINNGFVEGYNNKIKVIKRVSYGIRKYERLRKLIHLRTA